MKKYEGKIWFTDREVAEVTELTLETVKRLIKSGEIPSRKFGPKTTRVHRRDVPGLDRLETTAPAVQVDPFEFVG